MNLPQISPNKASPVKGCRQFTRPRTLHQQPQNVSNLPTIRNALPGSRSTLLGGYLHAARCILQRL